MVLDVVVAWALYRVFLPVHSGLSQLAAALRLVYAAVFLVAIADLFGAVEVLAGGERLGFLAASDVPAQAMLGIESFRTTWALGLGVFGLHLALVGLLAFRSGFVNRLLAVLLVVAGAGYLFDGLAGVLVGEGAVTVSTVTFVGELWFAIWLLAHGC